MLKLFVSGSASTKKDQTTNSEGQQNINSNGSSQPQNFDGGKDFVIIHSCVCCGTLVKLSDSVSKYKCSVCHTTVLLIDSKQPKGADKIAPELSLKELQSRVRTCQQSHQKSVSYHETFKPVERYVTEGFSSVNTLSKSFLLEQTSHRSFNIDYNELHEFFKCLIHLPTKRPYFKLLLAAFDLLRRPSIALNQSSNTRWLLLLLEIPTLKDCLYHERVLQNPKLILNTPEVKSVSYEIIKRVIGYLAQSGSSNLEAIGRWFYVQRVDHFSSKVQLVNLYISFHLTRLIYKKLNQRQPLRDSKSLRINEPISPTYSDYNNSAKLNSAISSPTAPTAPTAPPATSPSTRNQNRNSVNFLNLPLSFQAGFTSWSDWVLPSNKALNRNDNDIKLKVSDYGNEWHIKSAARFLSVLYAANRKKLPIYSFYNTLVDYVLVKQDFETWQNVFGQSRQNDPNQLLYDIIRSGGLSASMYNTERPTQLTFCQFPFLLSLGAKISILEYEARKQMERKAEEAFIKAIDHKKVMDVHLRIQVRRSHIAHDSITSIKKHQGDLKKALKVEFIGEPGIDAGGLKKEWFLLLTKALFNQENGMFYYNDESHLCWFAPMPLERNDELYYMVGVVLGLAIYNSTILDLKFPLVLYKKLLSKRVTLEDYTELFPSTGKGLNDLLNYKGDVSEFCLFFDTTFKDSFGQVVTENLISNGSDIPVTNENRRSYVTKYIEFYLNEIISPQFQSFHRGFHNVIGGNALSLFSPKEIEMLVCGNNETKIDTEVFKSITKYSGWGSEEDALKSDVCKWFWEWFDDLTYNDQKKFLSFVTGSDRIPATGISTMNFKVTRLMNSHKRLPVAHTCFNELCLYEYHTKEEMLHKLELSINESEGFGLR